MVKNSGLQVKLLIDRPGENSRPNSQSDEVVDAPPRPAGPRNYVPATQSYNKQTDNLREEYQRQRQVKTSCCCYKIDFVTWYVYL